MNLEAELRKKSFTPSKFEQNTDASAWKPKTLIDIEDALTIAKEYAEEMCKKQIKICCKHYYEASMRNEDIDLDCSPLATEAQDEN